MLPLADLAAAIRQRLRLELAIFAAVLLIVVIAAFMAPRIYRASATLLFDDAPIELVAGQAEGSNNLGATMNTQADVIRSGIVAARVVKDLNLITPNVLSQWRAETGGVGDVNLWYGARLMPALSVEQDSASRVLRVTYSSGDGAFAAAVANGFVQAYLAQKLELQTDPAKTYSRWYEERTREVRANLEKAQGNLTAFRRRTGIVDSESSSSEDNRLTDLQSALTGAEVGRADIEARGNVSVGMSPEVQNSGVVQGLRSAIASKAAQIQQLSASLGPKHPDRMAASAELAELRAKLATEISQQSQAIRVAGSAARSKESTLRGTLAGQKSRMLVLAADRAEYDVLRRDVDSARAAYDQVTQRLEVMRLSAMAPTAGVRQLDSARAPLLPSEPNITLRLLLGSVLAAMIAVGVAIALEFLRPRVRSAKSLQDATGAPVITTINFGKSATVNYQSGAEQKAA